MHSFLFDSLFCLVLYCYNTDIIRMITFVFNSIILEDGCLLLLLQGFVLIIGGRHLLEDGRTAMIYLMIRFGFDASLLTLQRIVNFGSYQRPVP